MCCEIYELDTAHFLTAPGLAWQAALKKTEMVKWYNIMIKVIQDILFRVDIQYPERLYKLYPDLPFLPKKMKIGKVEKPVANSNDKKHMLCT